MKVTDDLEMSNFNFLLDGSNDTKFDTRIFYYQRNRHTENFGPIPKLMDADLIE